MNIPHIFGKNHNFVIQTVAVRTIQYFIVFLDDFLHLEEPDSQLLQRNNKVFSGNENTDNRNIQLRKIPTL